METVVAEAARFLVSHSREPIRLGDVADHVGYSPFYLARSFEQYLGMPPGRFLLTHRFQHAKALLLAGSARVTDVCFEAGFASLGSFTTRFTHLVGSTPTEFRQLPDVLADSPPRSVLVPGRARGGDVVAGSVRLTPTAAAALGETVAVYVGLFRRRAAHGLPVSGAMLREAGPFALYDLPKGTYFLLASALSGSENFGAQLVPGQSVVGACARSVVVSTTAQVHRRDIVLDVAPAWRAPVLVALPMLACPNAQDWRSRR